MNDLLFEYKKRRPAIKKRLKEFAGIYHMTDSDIFAELAFCVFTPQLKALSCDAAVKTLKIKGLFFDAAVQKISRNISGHTTTEFYHTLNPIHVCNLWDIDTGAGWSGKLTIMDMDTKKYWQSDLTPNLYGGAPHRR